MSDRTIHPRQYGPVGQSGGPDNIACYTGSGVCFEVVLHHKVVPIFIQTIFE
jgi:hypothetical protein